jgi:hypothetical protein
MKNRKFRNHNNKKSLNKCKKIKNIVYWKIYYIKHNIAIRKINNNLLHIALFKKYLIQAGLIIKDF